MKKSNYSPSYYCLSIYYCLILMVLMSMPLAAYGKLISKPFEYSGYTRESFATATKESMYVPMADRTLVAIDIYFPAEFIPTEDEPTPPETFPAIMEYTPVPCQNVIIKQYQ